MKIAQCTLVINLNVLADSGFPRRGGANTRGGSANIRFCQIFQKNCMKLKEFGPPDAPMKCESIMPLVIHFGDILWQYGGQYYSQSGGKPIAF